MCLDSTSVKVHPNAAGPRKSSGAQSLFKNLSFEATLSRAKVHFVFAKVGPPLACRGSRPKGVNDENTCSLCVRENSLKIQLSAGNRHDAPEGRRLIESLRSKAGKYLLMDRAYEDDETRALALKRGLIPAVLPKKNRKTPWEYDSELYKRRNEVERFFLRLKRFRKVFTRYDKLDIIYFSFVTLALIFDALFM